MELYQEILRHILADGKIQVSFPELTNSDSTKIVELECYKALRKIKAILEDDSLEDSECFYRIEEIVCVFEDLAAAAGMISAEFTDREPSAEMDFCERGSLSIA